MDDWREQDREAAERRLNDELRGHGLTRRDLVERGATLAAALGLGPLLAACGDGGGGTETTTTAAPPFTGTLRVLGLAVDMIEPIRAAAERDLGFEVAFEPTSSPAMVRKATEQPGSFDLLSGYSYQVDQMWSSGNLVALDRTRIASWSSVTSLYKLGKATPGDAACTVGDGDAPFRKLYATSVHEAGELVQWGKDDGSGQREGEPEPPGVTGVPSTYNMDAIGYNAEELGLEPEEVSWGELFNPRWRGRVALFNEPTIGLQDAALAAEALGLMRFRDKGNLSEAEIDGLVKVLLKLKRRQQFRAFWSTLDESVNLMATGQVVVESMWWPAVELLQASGYPTRYAAPPEGYRAWAGCLFLSKGALASPSKLQACYDYVNWWHSGAPGATLMRFGYYNAVQEASRPPLVPQAEWDYWIDGKPAPSDLDSPFGQAAIRKGEVRDGGSLAERACRIAAWISYFDDAYEYHVKRWNELVAAS